VADFKGWIARTSWPLVVLFYAVLGATMALGHAPWGLWPLTFVGWAIVCSLFGAPRPALSGWALGTGYFAVTLSWIIEPFLVDIATHGWMAPFALGLMAGGLALFWGLAFWGATRIGGAIALSVALVLVEMLRATVLTGFPWGGVSGVIVGTGLDAGLAWVGAHGMTLVLLVGVVLIVRLRRIGAVIGVGVVATAVWFVPSVPQVALADVTVRLIQPNAPQDQKWDRDWVQVFFDRQVAYTAAEGTPDLVVWPETSVPFLMELAQPAFDRIGAAAGDTPVVVGIQRADGNAYYNSLLVLEDSKPVDVYDKRHLVPFGEYMPLSPLMHRFGLQALADIIGSGFTAGTGQAIVDIPNIGAALALICYEGIFAHELRYIERPRFLLLITNDAWFGQISGPYQHLAQARMRSIEFGLPMVRVGNTGISAVIDGKGRIVGQIPLGEAGYLDLRLPPALPETLYARTGDWPIWFVTVLTLLGLFMRVRHKSD
jgi:apolipoprotein N-acyltransferase